MALVQPGVALGIPTNLTASGLVRTGPAAIIGIFVASSTSGTIKIWDNTSAAGAVVVNTFTAVAGTWYTIPSLNGIGIYVTTGGTIDCTVFWYPISS